MHPSTTAPPPISSGPDPRVVDDLRRGEPGLGPTLLRDVPQLTRDGRRRDLSVIHRLFMRGKLAVDGRRVRLGWAIGPGGGRVSTRAAVDRFISELNGIDPTQPTAKQMNEQHRRAEARLAAVGL